MMCVVVCRFGHPQTSIAKPQTEYRVPRLTAALIVALLPHGRLVKLPLGTMGCSGNRKAPRLAGGKRADIFRVGSREEGHCTSERRLGRVARPGCERDYLFPNRNTIPADRRMLSCLRPRKGVTIYSAWRSRTATFLWTLMSNPPPNAAANLVASCDIPT